MIVRLVIAPPRSSRSSSTYSGWGAPESARRCSAGRGRRRTGHSSSSTSDTLCFLCFGSARGCCKGSLACHLCTKTSIPGSCSVAAPSRSAATRTFLFCSNSQMAAILCSFCAGLLSNSSSTLLLPPCLHFSTSLTLLSFLALPVAVFLLFPDLFLLLVSSAPLLPLSSFVLLLFFFPLLLLSFILPLSFSPLPLLSFSSLLLLFFFLLLPFSFVLLLSFFPFLL